MIGRFRIYILGLTTLCVITLACKSTESHPSAEVASAGGVTAITVTPNDVSILFPMDADRSFYAVLTKSGDIPNPAAFAPGEPALASDGEPFLPKDLVVFLRQQISTEAGKPLAAVKDLDSLDPFAFFSNFIDPEGARLIALRVDPCFNIRTINSDNNKCQAQLRLVWQIFFEDTPGDIKTLRVTDATIHVAYTISQGEFKDILTTIKKQLVAAGSDRELKQKLGSNALMLKQGANGPFTKAVIGLAHRYVRRSRMTVMSGLSISQNRFPFWKMTAVQVVNGQPKITPIVNAKPGQEDDSGAKDFLRQFFDTPTNEAALSPLPASNDSYVPFVLDDNGQSSPNNVNNAKQLTHLYNVLNPALHDVLDLDCSSCHRAVHILNAAGQLRPSDTSAQFKSHWDISTQDVQKKTAFLSNFHMFSFFPGNSGSSDAISLTIQPRVINESAVVADFINKYYP